MLYQYLILVSIYNLKLLFAQNYTSIWNNNVTTKNVCLGENVTKTSFQLDQQIHVCPFTKNYLVSPYYFDYKIKNPTSYNITQQIDSNNTVSFQVTDEYKICFLIAEICLQNVYYRQYTIKNPIFDNQIYITYDKPDYFNTNMKAIGFITGYNQNQSNILSLQLDYIKYDETQQDKGFQIKFSKIVKSFFQEININYIYFPEDQYQQSSSYYYFQEYDDKNILINSTDFDQNPNPGMRYTKRPLNTTLYVKSQNNTIYGINSFDYSNQKTNQVRASINFNENDNSYNYSTWYDSTINSITSQFVQFSMLNCSDKNKTINFYNSCVSQCPDKYFNQTDSIKQIQKCAKCSDNCLNCEKDQNLCISCNQNLPYLYNQTCYQQQPNNTYCKETEGYQFCSQCQPDCQKYCYLNKYCVDCINSQYQYKDKCLQQADLPPSVYNDQGKFYDCDPTCKNCTNKGPNNCSSCYEQQFTLQNSTCVCKDKQKGLSRSNYTCLPCKDQGCQLCTDDYTICKQCLSDMVLQNNICVCSDQAKYFDNIQFKCIQNPSYKNCNKLSQFSPKCEQCKQGFLNYQGTCVYCGNKKYVVSDNLCNGQCADNCVYCSNNISCHSYDDDMPCYFTCSSCSKPQSQNSCLSCISATRQLNNITNYCDCISGYEESGNIDCNKIKDPVSNSQLNFINVLFKVSLYIQLPLIFLPIYTYLQYTFLLSQQIGVIGLLQGVDGLNLRIQIMQKYSLFNFYNSNNLDLNSQFQSLVDYYNIFKQIQKSRKQQPNLNLKHQFNMNYFPKEFDISTISQILEQSGKFSKHFGEQNKKI
ncbi:hypothetical protein ABPG74_007203 [Tetrahymena malaccensis]